MTVFHETIVGSLSAPLTETQLVKWPFVNLYMASMTMNIYPDPTVQGACTGYY